MLDYWKSAGSFFTSWTRKLFYFSIGSDDIVASRERRKYIWAGAGWGAGDSHFQHREQEGLCALRMDVLGLRGQVCLDQKSGFHSTSHLLKGVLIMESLSGAKFRFISMPQQRGRGWVPVRSTQFPAVCRSCFSRLPAGHGVMQPQVLQCSSSIPQLLAQSACCFCLGLKVSPAESALRLVLAPSAGNYFCSVPPYVNGCSAVMMHWNLRISMKFHVLPYKRP